MREPGLPLPDLVPPPGGLERLRHSVEAGGGQRRAGWTGFALAACSVAVLALVLLPGLLQRHRTRTELARAVRHAVHPSESGALRVVDGGALALDSGQPGVRLYLVQSGRAEPAAPRR